MLTELECIFIDNSARGAKLAERLNIKRFMVDFESEGKAARQNKKNSRISEHSFEDLQRLRDNLKDTKLMVRMDPNRSLEKQLHCFKDANVDEVMIPMINNYEFLNDIYKMMGADFELVPLIETCYSLKHIDKILQLLEPKYVHFGLNDLHLEMKLKNMFLVYKNEMFHDAINVVQKKSLSFGIGGIAPLSAKLDLNPKHVLELLVSHKATGVILSRAFNKLLDDELEFSNSFQELQQGYTNSFECSRDSALNHLNEMEF